MGPCSPTSSAPGAPRVPSRPKSRMLRIKTRSPRTRLPPGWSRSSTRGSCPGEDIAVALIVAHTDATGTGHARALIDTTRLADLLDNGTGEVVLLGRVYRNPARPAAVMMNRQRQTGSMGDELTNAAIVALIGAFGAALVLRAAGSMAAFLTGMPQPTAGPASGLGVLFNPADPATALDADGLNPVAYWIVTGIMLGALTAAGAWIWVRLEAPFQESRDRPATPGRDRHRPRGDPDRLGQGALEARLDAAPLPR